MNIPDGAGNETFWVKRKRIAIESKIQTAEHKQSNHDPEYLSKFPNECRNHTKGTCHPEAVKRITKEMMQKQHNSIIPTVDRPKRLNR